MNKWQPIETVPQNTYVVLYQLGGDPPWRNGMAVGYWHPDDKPEERFWSVPAMRPTHWHPLPEPPK